MSFNPRTTGPARQYRRRDFLRTVGYGTTALAFIEKHNREGARSPAGSQPGDVLRLRGGGMPMMDGRGRGDLFAHLKVVIPRKLSADQRAAIEQAADLIGRRVEKQPEGFFDRVKRAFGGE